MTLARAVPALLGWVLAALLVVPQAVAAPQ
jgi:hypothetical protein